MFLPSEPTMVALQTSLISFSCLCIMFNRMGTKIFSISPSQMSSRIHHQLSQVEFSWKGKVKMIFLINDMHHLTLHHRPNSRLLQVTCWLILHHLQPINCWVFRRHCSVVHIMNWDWIRFTRGEKHQIFLGIKIKAMFELNSSVLFRSELKPFYWLKLMQPLQLINRKALFSFGTDW